MFRWLGVAAVTCLLCACSASGPTQADLQQLLRAPVIAHVTAGGMTLPKDSFSLDEIVINSTEKHTVADTSRYRVVATASVTLTENGAQILGEMKQSIHGSDIGAILRLQQFVRGLGFTLKKGDRLSYKVNAEIEASNNSYVIVDGTVDPE